MKVIAILFTCCLAVSNVGCQKKSDGKSSSSSGEKETKTDRHPMEQHLIGKWRGPVEFDEPAFVLALKNNGATQQRVSDLLRQRNAFLTEVTFSSDGKFRNRVVMGSEVFLPGNTTAPWRILKSNKDQLVIQTYEGADADQWAAVFTDKDNLLLKAQSSERDGITGYRLKRVE